MPETFFDRIIEVIKNIPKGYVATYGQIAELAGNRKAARQVVYALHNSSNKHNLPWHRVINSKGYISLRKGDGYEIQKAMLESEGIIFDEKDHINLREYQWEV